MKQIYIVFVNQITVGCFSSVDKAKKIIKNTHLISEKWCILESILDEPVINTHNIVCDCMTNPDKYYYNISSHYVLFPIFVIYDMTNYIVVGCYSSLDIGKKIIKDRDNYHIIQHNLDESLQ
jgi:hypothetical protein